MGARKGQHQYELLGTPRDVGGSLHALAPGMAQAPKSSLRVRASD